jgi:hypothetical protein
VFTERRQYLAAIGGIMRVTTATAPSGAALWEGLYYDDATTDRLWRYNGSAATPVNGRFGIALQSTAFTIAAGATSTITSTFEFEDTDGYGALGTNITIPTGLGGKYVITAYTDAGVNVAGNGGGIAIFVNATLVARQPMPVNTSQAVAARLVGVNAADVVTIQITNGHTSSANFTTVVEMYRMGD